MKPKMAHNEKLKFAKQIKIKIKYLIEISKNRIKRHKTTKNRI